jgi:hypothetical protein
MFTEQSPELTEQSPELTEHSPEACATTEEVRVPHARRTAEQRDQFAVAMALGERVSVWAKKHGVPKRTCYEWRTTKEYKLKGEEARRRCLERALGRLARNLTAASDRIIALLSTAESHAVQLQASRSVLKEFMTVRQHMSYDERMLEIERRLDLSRHPHRGR